METDDAIAIVGIACRFPGADDIEEFWKLLENGEDHVKSVPTERWNLNDIEVQNDEWKPYAEKSGLIKDFDKWDNKFFGISDSEAGWMDPQQCLALEVTYSALEDGGFTKESIKGTNTGVYIGMMNSDISLGLNGAVDEFNNFLVTGFAPSIIANRISYHFDIRGPSITLDTACSSALVALHLGSQAIKTGDCDMAICGGVNSILCPMNYVALSKAGMISKTGKSHTFSKDADGYARGEGSGIVVLKKLAKARQDGDKVWGVLVSGCNQDGQANKPITAPSDIQQRTLLEKIYKDNNIDPSEIQYIEAHGTGTPVGDTIETTTLAKFFTGKLPDGQQIPIGSVKTNIGHLESSAGTASLIKVLLMMKHEKTVPSLHFSDQNRSEKINFDNLPFVVSTQLSQWSRNDNGTRLACINCFGFGGTNSHVIIKQPRPVLSERKTSEVDISPYHVISITGSTIKALINTAIHFLARLNVNTYDIRDLTFTSLLKRDQMRFRIVCVVKSIEELKEKLADRLKDETRIMQMTLKEPRLIYLFCGVGTVWFGMCKELMNQSSIFKTTVDEIEKELQKYTKRSVIEHLTNPSQTTLNDPFMSPIAIFACQVGLFRLWDKLGVVPDVIIGQSIGEVAAAYAAGCLTLSEAVQITYHRSNLSAKSSGGKMLVVGNCNLDSLKQVLSLYAGRLNIAVYSSNRTVVVSGDTDAVDELSMSLSSNSQFPSNMLKALDVKCAYHSTHMKTASRELKTGLKNLSGREPSTVIISTVTGERVTGTEMCSAEYWSTNLSEPVFLSKAVANSVDMDKTNIFLEIGPSPILRAHLKYTTNAEAITIPSCKGPDELKTFANAIGLLHDNNVILNMEKISPTQGTITDIPRYKFQRSGNLIASSTVRASLQYNITKNSNHPFVFQKPLSDQFKVILSPETTPFIYEHVLDKMHIIPGALHLEIGLAVTKLITSKSLADISISANFIRPLGIGTQQKLELEVSVSKHESSFEIRRKQEVLCKGTFFTARLVKTTQIDVPRIRKLCPILIGKECFYNNLKDLGFEYGPTLQVIKDSRRSDNEYLAELEVPHIVTDDMSRTQLHPSILDGILQTLSLSWLTMNSRQTNMQSRPMPVKVGSLTLKRSPVTSMYVYGKLTEYTQTHATINILLLSVNGEVIAEIENYEVRNMGLGSPLLSLHDKSYMTKWLKMDIEEKQEIKTKNLICLCFTQSAYDLCRAYCNEKSSFTFLMDSASKDMGTIYDTIEKGMAKQNITFDKVEQLIYFPGFRHLSETMDIQSVYQNVTLSSCFLLTILKTFMSKSINIPILVVTENTQQAVGLEDQIYNINGAELWGMCRCLMRERTYSNIKLIDLVSDVDLSLIHHVIKKTKSDHVWKYSPEFKISNGSVYINQIVRSKDDNSKYRMNPYNPKQALELRSLDFNNLKDMFFVHKEQIEGISIISLNVETAVISPSFCPVTLTLAVDDPDPWKSFRPNGHTVLAVEICGTLSKDETKHATQDRCLSCLWPTRNKVTPYKQDGNPMTFVACITCAVSNVVDVPFDCVVPKSDFPHYNHGDMHRCIISLAITEQLKRRIPLGIIYDVSSKPYIPILQSLCRSLNHKVVFVYDVKKIREEYNLDGKFQIILLVENLIDIVNYSRKMSVAANRIITCSQYMDKPSERLFRTSFPYVEICMVNNDDILSQQTLPMLVQKLRTCLSKGHINLRMDTNYQNNESKETVITFNNTNKETALTNEIQAKNLMVQVSKDTLFHKTSGYLVIGGLTGLGWEIVELIARNNGGCIATLGRREPNEQQLVQMKILSDRYNCRIISIKGDISDFESLKFALQEYHIKATGFPLKGVFQGAAVVDDAIIVNMTTQKCEKVLKPKVLGTLNLHQLTKDMNLDYFVLQSSVTSVFGNSGQTNYGAGNAFMDTFAYFRKSIGLSGQTINWGPLKLGILTANEHVEEHLKHQGYESLQTDEIIECFLHALTNNYTQIVYGIFNWEKMVRQSPDMIHLTSKLRPLLTELNILGIFGEESSTNIIADLEELRKMSFENCCAKIEEILCIIAADIFAVEQHTMQTNTTFSTMGVDSMKAMAFINTIYEHFSCNIHVVEIMEPTANIQNISILISKQVTGIEVVEGTVPVGKFMHLKEFIAANRRSLNPFEQEVLHFETLNRKNYSFIQGDIFVMNQFIDKKDVENAFQTIKMYYPELSSVFYTEKGETICIMEPHSNYKEIEQALQEYNTLVHEEGSAGDFDHAFHLAVTKDDVDCDSIEEIVIDWRMLKVIHLRRKDQSVVRVLCDRIAFDRHTMAEFCEDLQLVLEGKAINKSFTTNDDGKRSFDEALQPHGSDCSAYWTNALSHNILPIYFSNQLDDGRCAELCISMKNLCLERNLSSALRDYIRKENLHLRKFFISIYQLFLHVVSGNEIVSVASYVNVRQFYIHSSINGNLENFVPFIAQFEKNDELVSGFLQQSMHVVQKGLDYGLLPFRTMEHMFMNPLVAANAFLHGVFYDEASKGAEKTNSNYHHLIRSFDSRLHTFLHVIDDNEDFKLLFHYQQRFVDEKIASNLLDGIMNMLKAVVTVKRLTISEIKKHAKTLRPEANQGTVMESLSTKIANNDMIVQLSEEIDNSTQYEGIFLKETKYGWDHKVVLRIKEDVRLGKSIQWQSGSKTKKLSFRTILNAKSATINGIHIVAFATDARHYIFKTTDEMAFQLVWKSLHEISDEIEATKPESTDL